MILFGVRSPLIIDLEESLLRLGIEVEAAVSINGTPRLLGRERLVELTDYTPRGGAGFVATAFAPERRRELTAMALELGLAKAEAVVDPTAIVPRSLRVGAGTYINAGVVIGGMSFIGESAFVNRAASLGHHSVLADFVTIGPGATLAGNVQVGEGSMIGAGATIFPNTRIGAGVLISAGSVVRKHVPDGRLVAGNPAVSKPFVPQSSALFVEDEE